MRTCAANEAIIRAITRRAAHSRASTSGGGPSARRRLAGVPESQNNAATIDRLMGGAADFARGVRT